MRACQQVASSDLKDFECNATGAGKTYPKGRPMFKGDNNPSCTCSTKACCPLGSWTGANRLIASTKFIGPGIAGWSNVARISIRGPRASPVDAADPSPSLGAALLWDCWRSSCVQAKVI